MKKVLVLVLVAAFVLGFGIYLSFAENKNLSKDNVIAIATTTLKGQGINAAGADIVYDEGGKLWEEKFGMIGMEDQSPNHGILKRGFLKNYYIICYDFKEPLKDVWVFIDKDTGEVLEVYKE